MEGGLQLGRLLPPGMQGIGFVLRAVELRLELFVLAEGDLEGDGEGLLDDFFDGVRVGACGEEGLLERGCRWAEVVDGERLDLAGINIVASPIASLDEGLGTGGERDEGGDDVLVGGGIWNDEGVIMSSKRVIQFPTIAWV